MIRELPPPVDIDEVGPFDSETAAREMKRMERRRAAIAESLALERLKKLPPDGSFLQVTPENRTGPGGPGLAPAVAAWMSRDFVALLYEDLQREGTQRLSVQRARAIAAIREHRRDLRPISWTELMDVKRGVGLGSAWAIELYPSDEHALDAGPTRHLWLVGAPPPFGWRLEIPSPHPQAGERLDATGPHPTPLG